MNTQTTDRTAPPAAQETFILAKCEEGYRVCSPLNPAKQFTVTGIPDDPRCNCPDFEHPNRPPDWQCKHILAVLQGSGETANARGNGAPAPSGVRGSDDPPARTARRAGAGKNGGGAVMLLKRSVSPDGRIDALSVEFSCPVNSLTTTAIKEQATTILDLQAEIAAGFLKKNGNGAAGKAQANGNDDPTAVSGQLLSVGSMNGRWGKRLFLNVMVNGEVLKLFGSEKQLAEAVRDAGFASMADHITEGMTMNLPCRVVTKPNGKYVNVERVLAAKASAQGRG